MARVITNCPTTGAPVPTGHVMNENQFEATTARLAFRCSDCGEIHHFQRGEAWLKEARGALR